jgi:hypothetical protein
MDPLRPRLADLLNDELVQRRTPGRYDVELSAVERRTSEFNVA